MTKVDELREAHADKYGRIRDAIGFLKSMDALIEAARQEGEASKDQLEHAYIGQPECVWCGHFGPNDDPNEPCITRSDLTAEGMARFRDRYFELGEAKGREEERAGVIADEIRGLK